MSEQTTEQTEQAEREEMGPPLPVCRVCIQPDYCRAQCECHYTKSPFFGPDGAAHWLTIAEEHPQ